MTDRTIRNLAHLGRSASTARVLNLLKIWFEHGYEPDWAERPVFQTLALNRSLIIKHRLRRDEVDLLTDGRMQERPRYIEEAHPPLLQRRQDQQRTQRRRPRRRGVEQVAVLLRMASHTPST